MNLFLSALAPHPGIRLRNQNKYLGPACLNGRLPHFQHEFTSLDLDWNISSSVRLQVLYSHSMVCTEIPWESLTSMVISLALVNSSHHWLVIKWFLPCPTSRHCNHMVRFVSLRVRLEDPGLSDIFTQVAMEFVLSHITWIHLCIGHGYVIISSWIYACV